MSQRLRRMSTALLSAAVLFAGPMAGAHAAPAPGSSPHIAEIRSGPGRQQQLGVYSAAMDRIVRTTLLRAADPDKPAPTLYLLNGSSGGTDGNWIDRTDIERFFADKQVNVVVLLDGGGSYFADWRNDDPVLGKQRWATFLTGELPRVIDAEFDGTGANAIAGISMGGTAVFQLALGAPGFYRAIGSYSGCAHTSDPAGQALVQGVVTMQGGNVANLWGPLDDPEWRAKDPLLHVDELRDTVVYVSAGTGLPGPNDNLESAPDLPNLIYQFAFGAPLEAVASACTKELQSRLLTSKVPVTVDLRPTGTHSWGYWQDALHNSWPMFEEVLR